MLLCRKRCLLQLFTIEGDLFSSSSSSPNSRGQRVLEDEYMQPRWNKPAKKDILDQRILSVCDKFAIPDRQACHLITAVLKALDLQLDDYNISRSLLRKLRAKNREDIAKKTKAEFQV